MALTYLQVTEETTVRYGKELQVDKLKLPGIGKSNVIPLTEDIL